MELLRSSNDYTSIAPVGAISNELTVPGTLSILKRYRKIIFRTIAICFLLGVVACVFMKSRYRAVGEIEVQKSATDGLGLVDPASRADLSTDALDANITLQTQANILESANLALKVIEDLNLEHNQDLKSTFNPIAWTLGLLNPGGAQDPANVSLENAPHRREHAVKAFQKRLKITPVPGTRLIDIQYTSTSPETAAAVVNDMAKSLVDYQQQTRFAATNQVSGWLTGQLGDIKKEAEALQSKVEDLQRESGIYSLGVSDNQGKEIAYSSTLDRLQQATQSLSAATSNRILKGALYKTVENGDPELLSGLAGSTLAGASPAVNNSFQLLQNLRTQQATLASQVASDTSKYGSSNPKLDDDKAALDSINSQIQSEVQRIGDRAANDYKASQGVENNMRSVYQQEHKSADMQNDKAISLLIARQEATDARSLYQTLFSHLKAAGVIEGLRSSNISVVDAGRVPSKPLPDILIVLGLSLVCGIFLGTVGAFFADATNDKVEGIAKIEYALQSRIFAVLPRFAPKKQGLKLTSGDKASGKNKLELLDDPNTAYVEALRSLRTSLIHSSAGGRAPRTILITSAAEKEGKSTLTLNLAAALTLNGFRVLLVDADMRSAGLSAYMGVPRTSHGLVEHAPSGLSEALSSSKVEPAIMTPFPDLPGLVALPAGARTNYAAELLGSERMQSLLKQWAEYYDYVLIDSPPVLAVTDALILESLADTTLLVARHGRSTQRSVERAYQTLHQLQGKSVSVVVNGVQRDSTSFDEFYGYTGTNYYKEA